MININNNFFFEKKGFDLKNNKLFQSNFDKVKDHASKLYDEFLSKENEFLNSFSSSYQKNIRNLKDFVNKKNKKKVIIGLGGSSSGSKALSFFLNDDIIYLDNLDYGYLKNFFESRDLKEYYFFVISKSGNTFETLAILNLLIEESKKIINFNIYDSILIVTEDKKSILKTFADKYKIQSINHNSSIGGRFSVLSETGILPFVELNIKIEDGSEKFINLLKKEDEDLSPVINTAILATFMEEMKLNIYCNLIYNYRLKHFSYWFHQLHAESLGKNNKCMTPTTSICPKDHHSMVQLYLGGPKDKIFNIFSPQEENYFTSFGNHGFFNIENYKPYQLLEKQLLSVVEVFREKKIPHRIFTLKDNKNPINMIELFSFFLLETILLGKLMNVDVISQPEVELVKEKINKS